MAARPTAVLFLSLSVFFAVSASATDQTPSELTALYNQIEQGAAAQEELDMRASFKSSNNAPSRLLQSMLEFPSCLFRRDVQP